MHVVQRFRVSSGVGLCKLLLFFIVPFNLFPAEQPSVPYGTLELERPYVHAEAPFPSLYFAEALEKREVEDRGRPYWVDSENEVKAALRSVQNFSSLLLNDDILAFYGHPLSSRMGILGVHSKEVLNEKLEALSAEYDAVNGDRGIIKAFYIIYGTVWPEGEIGLLSASVLEEYIEFALKNNILVFIDHQIGRYDPVASLESMLPYLRYPNVHLALDPEWRTEKPMEEIGTVYAEEINKAQQVMEEYIISHGIGGERMLVIHQFHWRMIQNREAVRSDYDRVRLIHCADGFGHPSLKRRSYSANAEAENIPIKAFKLFLESGIQGAGFDSPLMSPAEVYTLDPQPYLIMYQ